MKNFRTSYQLSDAQKQRSLDLFKQHEGSLLHVVREIARDPDAKGSSAVGRAIREFWIEQGLRYRTKIAGSIESKKDLIEKRNISLSDEDKQFLKDNYNESITKKELAQTLWPKEAKEKNFFEGRKFSLLSSYVNDNFNDINPVDDVCLDKYVAPRLMTSLVKKVNKVIIHDLNAEKLSLADKKGLEKLITYLNAPRFLQVVNSYFNKNDRDLFESEFVRSTWDKPDLSSDELNLYINVTMDYVNLKEIDTQRQKLSLLFTATEGQGELAIKLTEAIKAKEDAYDKCHKRISAILSKLNMDRAKRTENHDKKNASIMNLVETFQQEEERLLMIKMAEMQKEIVYEEADKLEKMVEWKARILGISKYDAV